MSIAWVNTVIAAVAISTISALVTRLTIYKTRVHKTQVGLVAMMEMQMISTYFFNKRQGFIYYSDKKAFLKLKDAYKLNGGNGAIDDMERELRTFEVRKEVWSFDQVESEE